MAYTYEDFRKAATDSGLLGEFSDADLKLAEKNPDAGMSILSYKQDYHAATTDEARALANYGAEQIRSSYGNYSAGKDGGKFYAEPMSPSSFSYAEAPTFSYDQESDPAWQSYKKQYTREGRRATEDMLGQAAAMTGGIPSTAAITAAGQAGDYYNAQMTDKAADLYESAYNRYLNELNQYNTDKAFAYGQHLDEINDQTLRRQEELEAAISRGQNGDFAGLKELGWDTSYLETQRDRENAEWLAQFGDTSGLEALGVDLPEPGPYTPEPTMYEILASITNAAEAKAYILGLGLEEWEANGLLATWKEMHTTQNAPISGAGLNRPTTK